MNKKEFYIYRFHLLQSYFNGSINNGRNFINNLDAYVYAWSHEIFPIFDCCFADDEFKDNFTISKDYVDKVANTLDKLMQDYNSNIINSYPDYYSLQFQLGGKINNLNLSEVLRYLYLSNRFTDTKLWSTILSNAPAGSESITNPFNKNNDVIIFLA